MRLKEASPSRLPATVYLREIRALGYEGGVSVLGLADRVWRGPQACGRGRKLRRPGVQRQRRGPELYGVSGGGSARRAQPSPGKIRRDAGAMAGFPALKMLEDYDVGFTVAAPRRQIKQLAALAFLARKEHLVFLGRLRRRQDPVHDRGRSQPQAGGRRVAGTSR